MQINNDLRDFSLLALTGEGFFNKYDPTKPQFLMVINPIITIPLMV